MFDFIFTVLMLACIAFYVVSTFQVIVETWEGERYLSIFGIASLVIVLTAVICCGLEIIWG